MKERHLKDTARREKRIRAIDREAEALRDCTEPVVVFGKNDLSDRFVQRIREYPCYWGRITLAGENDAAGQKIEERAAEKEPSADQPPAKKSNAVKLNAVKPFAEKLDAEKLDAEERHNTERTLSDLLYLRDRHPRFYCMSRFQNRLVESDLLDLSFEHPEVHLLGYGTEERVRGCALLNAYDPLLGFSRTDAAAERKVLAVRPADTYTDASAGVCGSAVTASDTDKLPGFTAFSNRTAHPGEREWRILTLGGSTSDPTFANLRSWSELLFERLDAMGRCITIYAGGIGGYTSAQEMKKLLRDGLILRPDAVLSYSGVNDAVGRYMEKEHPFFLKEEAELAQQAVAKGLAVNRLQTEFPMAEVTLGVQDSRSAFALWLEHERVMAALCREFGMRFHAVLQPARADYMAHNAFYREAELALPKTEFPWLTDGRPWLTETPEAFYDFCHVYERGNRVIARQMLALLLRDDSPAEGNSSSGENGAAEASPVLMHSSACPTDASPACRERGERL